MIVNRIQQGQSSSLAASSVHRAPIPSCDPTPATVSKDQRLASACLSLLPLRTTVLPGVRSKTAHRASAFPSMLSLEPYNGTIILLQCRISTIRLLLLEQLSTPPMPDVSTSLKTPQHPLKPLSPPTPLQSPVESLYSPQCSVVAR